MLKEAELRTAIEPTRWLVGDDDVEIGQAYADSLEMSGLQATICADPDEVLEIYMAGQSEFDILLTDFNYGRGFRNGLYVATCLSEATIAPFPIIMSSGTVFNPAEQAQIDRVIHLRLPKPTSIKRIFEAVSGSPKVQNLLRARQEFYSAYR